MTANVGPENVENAVPRHPVSRAEGSDAFQYTVPRSGLTRAGPDNA